VGGRRDDHVGTASGGVFKSNNSRSFGRGRRAAMVESALAVPAIVDVSPTGVETAGNWGYFA
jgi:hypothetical protein